MISEIQKGLNVLSDGETAESIKMSLDLDSAQILMQMLSKNLYSDAIGSTIRECASNALDSHRKAGVDKPIIVYLGCDTTYNYEFTVEDFGVGLDDNDVANIISKYGKSTKRDSAKELGMMGLGFKAPLAYTSSFYFITRKNGIEYKYMMYEGETDNIIDLLYKQPTTKENGVKVIIPVKYNDRGEFATKIKTQLAYFESIYFDVSGIDNNFSIFRADDYQHSEINTIQSLHLCLDNVCYPLDFEKLGIKRIDFPVALRFGLSDGIFPTPNREAVRYSVESKKIILEKIIRVADKFVEKYNTSITENNNIKDVFTYYDSGVKSLDFNGTKYDISAMIAVTTIPIAKPKLEGIDLLSLSLVCNNKNQLLGEYGIKYQYTHGRITEIKNNYTNGITVKELNKTEYYLFTGSLMGNKKEYIKTLLRRYDSYKFIKKIKHYRLGNKNKDKYDSDTYWYMLGLKNFPKSQWRQLIQEYQKIQAMLTSNFIDYDTIEVSQDWLDARKKQRVSVSNGGNRRLKIKGEVIGKQAERLERCVSGKNCKFVSSLYKLEDIHKYPGLIVYAPHEKAAVLDELYYISERLPARFITFSDREIRVLEKIEIHNLMSLKTFMEGNNKPFQRLVTAYLIDKLINEHHSIFYKKDHLEKISKDLHSKLVELQVYKDANYHNASKNIYEAMLEVAKSKNLFDTSIYSTYLSMKKLLAKLPFLSPVMDKMDNYYNGTNNNTAMVNILCDLFKYYKHRIDYTNYNITINDSSWMDEILPVEEDFGEEQLEEENIEEVIEELTEETIEELQEQLEGDQLQV